MELGIGSYAFRWAQALPRAPLSVRGMIDTTAAELCTLLQIADNPELDSMPMREVRDLREYAADRGVRLQCGASGLSSATLARQLNVASALDSDVVRIVLDADGVHPSDREVAELLTEWAPRYGDAGVIIAIENHFLTPSKNLRGILDGVAHPAVGVCLDTANSIMVGEWPTETISLLRPYARCLHLKDYAIAPDSAGVGGHIEGRALGTGWLEVGALLESLQPNDEAMGGRLGVVIEQWLPREESPDETLIAEADARRVNLEAARRHLAAMTRAGGTP